MSARRMSGQLLTAALVTVLAACGQSVASTAAPAAIPTAAATSNPPTMAPTPEPTARPWSLLPGYPSTALDASTAAALQAVLDGLVAHGMPDAVAAVVTAKGSWAGAAGIDGPDSRPADVNDVFNIASVSKPILAALFLRLAQDGTVDLDAPLASYLGDLPVDANGATVLQALQMRAGFGETPSSALSDASADCSRIWSRTDALVSIGAPVAEPGGIFMYSNPSYKLLGYAAEQVTGKPLDAAFDEMLFAPLGLDRILLQTSTRPTPKPWAVPTGTFGGTLALDEFGTGGTLPCVSLSTFSFSTSAVASDAPSLARWAWGLFAGDLIDREHLEILTTPFDGIHTSGLELLPNRLHTVAYGMHGGSAGYSAFLVVVPERQAVAVVFVNYQEADVESAARDLIEALPAG